jgi:hypothetical protein
MCQSLPVYHESPSLALLEPWMLARLPRVVDPIARHHNIQLAAGIFREPFGLARQYRQHERLSGRLCGVAGRRFGRPATPQSPKILLATIITVKQIVQAFGIVMFINVIGPIA